MPAVLQRPFIAERRQSHKGCFTCASRHILEVTLPATSARVAPNLRSTVVQQLLNSSSGSRGSTEFRASLVTFSQFWPDFDEASLFSVRHGKYRERLRPTLVELRQYVRNIGHQFLSFGQLWSEFDRLPRKLVEPWPYSAVHRPNWTRIARDHGGPLLSDELVSNACATLGQLRISRPEGGGYFQGARRSNVWATFG